MAQLFTDAIIARVLEEAAQSDRIDFSFARRVAVDFPDASGLSFSFALTSAANGLEGFSQHGRAAGLYRLAAMVAADLFSYEMRGEPLPDGRVLAAFWDEGEIAT